MVRKLKSMEEEVKEEEEELQILKERIANAEQDYKLFLIKLNEFEDIDGSTRN